jgi:hypothetical protein
MLEWFGDIGGVLEFFKLTLGGFVGLFSAQKIRSLLANRFYYWEAEPYSYRPDAKSSRGCCKPPKPVNRNARYKPELAFLPNNEENVEIPVPPKLEWYQLYQYITCICGKRDWFKTYEEAIERVDIDVTRSLDYMTYVRRMRMHGFALTSMLNTTAREFISKRSE